MTDKNKILLVIDLQKQFRDNNRNYERCIDYIKAHRNDYITVIGTYFINNDDSMYEKHLDWNGCMDVTASDLEYPYDAAYCKYSYSANAGEQAYNTMEYVLRNRDIIKPGTFAHPGDEEYPIYVIGCDSDACVLATAFSFWDKGYNFRILSDLVYTTADGFDNETVIKLMRRNFGDCIISSKDGD